MRIGLGAPSPEKALPEAVIELASHVTSNRKAMLRAFDPALLKFLSDAGHTQEDLLFLSGGQQDFAGMGWMIGVEIQLRAIQSALVENPAPQADTLNMKAAEGLLALMETIRNIPQAPVGQAQAINSDAIQHVGYKLKAFVESQQLPKKIKTWLNTQHEGPLSRNDRTRLLGQLHALKQQPKVLAFFQT